MCRYTLVDLWLCFLRLERQRCKSVPNVQCKMNHCISDISLQVDLYSAQHKASALEHSIWLQVQLLYFVVVTTLPPSFRHLFFSVAVWIIVLHSNCHKITFRIGKDTWNSTLECRYVKARHYMRGNGSIYIRRSLCSQKAGFQISVLLFTATVLYAFSCFHHIVNSVDV